MEEKEFDEEKELELSVDKIYKLPEFTYIEYNGFCLAIAPDIGKWIVLENNVQLEILKMLANNVMIANVMEKYDEYEDDVISVLTQIEAKRIDSEERKSVFTNTRLHLHLTNKCNLKCPHCYMNSGTGYENELSTEEIKKLCADFKECGGTDVSLTGGEPTVRSDFFDIAEYIDNLGMKLSIFTNGYIWDSEKVERLSKLKVEGVQISIDGYDEVSNSKVRGPGAFEHALNAVDLFIKQQIYVKVAVTAPYDIIKSHQDDYIRFSNYLLDTYGRDSIEINYSYFFMQGREISQEEIEKNKNDYYKLVDKVVKSIYKDIDEDSFVDNVSSSIYDSCGFGGLNVMANGDFYFCDRIPDVNKSGNIRTKSFEEIFKLMKIAEDLGRIDNFEPCGNCELKYICGGGCRAEYFKDFTKISDITKVDFSSIPARKCDRKNKEKYYKLMIETNERFFS